MFTRVRELDRPLLGVTAALALFGFATLYSAGQTDVPTVATTIWQKQLVWLGVGLLAAVLAFRLSPRLLEWATPYAYTLVMLLLARWLAERRSAPITLRELAYLPFPFPLPFLGPPAGFPLLSPLVIAGVPFLLVMAQPDLGSAIVLIAIMFAMLFWAGTKPSLLLLLSSPAIGLVLAFSTIIWGGWIVLLFGLLLWWRPYVWEGLTVMSANFIAGAVAVPLWQRLAPYQQNRLLAFLNPEVDPRATGWHVIQSRVAVGSGGLLGKGYTLGSQKRLAFLPAQHTDFIFSVVGEELGFVGVMVALALFVALLLVLLRIARRATDQYSSLVVFGLMAMLFTHIVENVGMTVNLLPITGIPLPFFSYGGSFLLTCSVAIGLALRVAWESRLSGYTER